MREWPDAVDSAERTRTALADIVALFSRAWASGSPPELATYLPPAGPSGASY
nr:hypothetical protein [Nocardia paucivorans]